ncbi:MAG: AMP nucleosidase [Alphaproteobacteria bacterium]|nr:AMP nucleosidase [Alphaproteobacteria bacterium]
MESKFFTNANKAVDYAKKIYNSNIEILQSAFEDFTNGKEIAERVSAYYPYIKINIKSARIENKNKGHLSYGLITAPGIYKTTLTAFNVFEGYYLDQISLLLNNHKVPVEIGLSKEKIPLHFALSEDTNANSLDLEKQAQIPDLFDVPNLSIIDDDYSNGSHLLEEDIKVMPLSLFRASRVDLSLKRLAHYTGTNPEDFQRYILFTNYQFYIDEFKKYAEEESIKKGKYLDFKSPDTNQKNIQMPAYHLKAEGHKGITIINIGVGPSNAKTITDHVAVLRPHTWMMLGHCAGLRNSQKLGDYVLAHAYLRLDGILDDIVPLSIPIPALSEIQNAIQDAIMEITKTDKNSIKNLMRTGTVITTGDRNWEIDKNSLSIKTLSDSRAIALDMESATIATNGYRFRIPYGTLLSISDKPLHGELKLPGMANEFYKKQISQHLHIGVKAMELLRENGPNKLHSRKLRSFKEVGFR